MLDERKQVYKSLVQDTLNDQIYRQLKEKLITGEFRPGDRLVLRKLSATLGTSPVPVRDALQKLESIGALRLERTFYVPHLTLANPPRFAISASPSKGCRPKGRPNIRRPRQWPH